MSSTITGVRLGTYAVAWHSRQILERPAVDCFESFPRITGGGGKASTFSMRLASQYVVDCRVSRFRSRGPHNPGTWVTDSQATGRRMRRGVPHLCLVVAARPIPTPRGLHAAFIQNSWCMSPRELRP